MHAFHAHTTQELIAQQKKRHDTLQICNNVPPLASHLEREGKQHCGEIACDLRGFAVSETDRENVTIRNKTLQDVCRKSVAVHWAELFGFETAWGGEGEECRRGGTHRQRPQQRSVLCGWDVWANRRPGRSNTREGVAG